MNNMTNTQASFFGLGIAPGILDVLHRLKFTVPTPIQLKAIPPGIEGKDIIGIAQTGTGKTLAFGIPMIQRLTQRKGRGLVLVPTRELALQVNEILEKLAPVFNIKTVVLIGGESIGRQFQTLRRNPRILVATPGRLLDHMEQRTVHLNDICNLVLDEADRMLDMGFAPQIKRILAQVPRDRQTMLFSATMPAQIVNIASSYMQMPVRTEIAPSGTVVELVTQEVYMVRKDRKGKLLSELLKKYTGSVLMFVRTKRGATKVTRLLRNMGHNAAEIHANRSLNQRKEALDGFKSGRYRILVATDIAARGIDVIGIEVVINFDLPDDPENYVHRIGRTGRAGRAGRAISLATPDQESDLRQIEKIIRMGIPRSQTPNLPADEPGAFQTEPSRPRESHGRPRQPQGRPYRGGRPGGEGRPFRSGPPRRFRPSR